jgi:2-beta-glucuronyltransferase
MKRVILVTAHYLESRNKAGFHWLADAFWRGGWDVTFFTESLSWLSWLRRDYRFGYPVRAEANRLFQVRERLASFVWLTHWHPVNLRLGILNRLSKPWFATYGKLPLHGMEEPIAHADLFVFDSTHGLQLFERCKQLNPQARFVYRVSDDLPLTRNHPVLLETETRILPRFDMVSVPSPHMLKRFSHLPHAVLHKHALRKDLFDAPHPSPYQGPGPHVVFVGRGYFDHDFVRRAARLFPDWRFHVIGRIADVPAAQNIIAYGERHFLDIIPYLQHADVGLQTLTYQPGAECFTDSLKMHQYTYCRLPIVAPRFLQNDRPHVFYYEPGDDISIRQALEAAVAFDRRLVPVEQVATWDDMITQLAEGSLSKLPALTACVE